MACCTPLTAAARQLAAAAQRLEQRHWVLGHLALDAATRLGMRSAMVKSVMATNATLSFEVVPCWRLLVEGSEAGLLVAWAIAP